MASLSYATHACPRCGGSGRYSYCTMYGDTCFACRGAKQVLTRAGALAKARVGAFIREHFSVPVTSLAPGQWIRMDGRARQVVRLEPDTTVSTHTAENGRTVETPYVTVVMADRVSVAGFTSNSLSMPVTATVTLSPRGADWDRVIAFARTIKSGVTVVDRQEVAS